jgi:hypothetical protein
MDQTPHRHRRNTQRRAPVAGDRLSRIYRTIKVERQGWYQAAILVRHANSQGLECRATAVQWERVHRAHAVLGFREPKAVLF